MSKRIFVVTTLVTLFMAQPHAFASTLAFTSDGSNIKAFEGECSIASIGSIALPKGKLAISGITAEVSAVPDWLFDRHVVLTGTVVNPKLELAGLNNAVVGLILLTKGEWFSNLNHGRGPEILTLTNGTVLSGRITGVQSTSLDMELANGTHKSVHFSEVVALDSSRAFTFRIPLNSIKLEPSDGSYTTEVVSASLQPTSHYRGARLFASNQPQVPKNNLAGTEGAVSNKQIAAMIATDIVSGTIVPAIAIPITFTRSTLHARQLEYINQNNSVGQRPFSLQIWGDGSIHSYPTR